MTGGKDECLQKSNCGSQVWLTCHLGGCMKELGARQRLLGVELW